MNISRYGIDVIYVGLLLVLLTVPCAAQVMTTIRPDGSLGTQVDPPNNDDVYTIRGGTTQGTNLFHSFDHFDVGTGDTAQFVGNDDTQIDIISSRVTGGQPSHIDGTLESTIPDANLFFLNPNGVMFGANAALKVKGSFHVSTASYLRFQDGTKFDATRPRVNGLTSHLPEAFGFLDSPEAITINGSQLSVSADHTLSVVGGDIGIDGGGLSAPSGQIYLISVASHGELAWQAHNQMSAFNVERFTRLGEIVLESASINVSDFSGGTGNGTVLIRGGSLEMRNASNIRADRIRAGESGAPIGVDIEVREDIDLVDRANISARSFSDAGGDIRIKVKNLLMRDDAQILTSSALSGAPGNITVDVEHLQLLESSEIGASNGGREEGGLVKIKAESVLIDGEVCDRGCNPSRILSDTTGAGSDGIIRMEVGTLTIQNGGQISTTTGGAGRGGTVIIAARESVTISGRGPESGKASEILSLANKESSNDAGNVTITARVVSLQDGGQISTSTFSVGQGGDVEITALDRVELTANSAISAESRDTQDDGENLAIATQTTEPKGDAGSIIIRAPNITLREESSVTTRADNARGGTIMLKAQMISLNDSQITASVNEGSQGGGSITINGVNTLDSNLTSRTAAAQVILENDSVISANTVSGGGANLDVNAAFIRLDNSRMMTNTDDGMGGNITTTNSEAVVLASSHISADAADGLVQPGLNMLPV